jgi:hypothetical protein
MRAGGDWLGLLAASVARQKATSLVVICAVFLAASVVQLVWRARAFRRASR